MATLTVGAGQQYSTINAAVAASHDGDVLMVQAGTYTNDFSTINTKITLQGVGGMVKMVATGNIPNDKGIFITNTDVTIDHFEFSGAKGPSNNDAGIRYQAGNLTVTNSYFHNNQNGILANASTGVITISNSEFAFNGAGDGQTHNLYVGDVATLNISNSYFHDAVVGNEIKSRAEVTNITNTRVFDNNGTASWSIDLPNGGRATLTGNTIEQGPNSQNSNIISFGVEGGVHANSSLTMNNNVVINDLGRGNVILNATGTTGTVAGLKIWGGVSASDLPSGVIVSNGVTYTGASVLAARPTLDTSHPFDTPAGGETTTPPATGGGETTTTPPATGGGGASPPATGPIVQGDHGESVTGTSAADTIVLGQGGGSVTGGAGADTFVLSKAPTAASHITDYQIGADQFDISGLLKSVGYKGSDPLADGYLKATANSAGGTTVFFDADGKGPGAATALVIIDHLSPTALGFPPETPAATVITQPDNGAAVKGTSGADIIVAGRGGGSMTGGAGADIFDFNATPSRAGHITDFKAGTDKIDISTLLQNAGYKGSDPIGDGYLTGSITAAGTTIYFDSDGYGSNAHNPVALVTLDGVALQNANDFLFH